MDKVYIYGLWDPRNYQLKYIGKTIDIDRRLRDHVNDAKKEVQTYNCNWIRQLLGDGLEPAIDILEECSENNWEEIERAWIADAKKHGLNLTNLTE